MRRGKERKSPTAVLLKTVGSAEIDNALHRPLRADDEDQILDIWIMMKHYSLQRVLNWNHIEGPHLKTANTRTVPCTIHFVTFIIMRRKLVEVQERDTHWHIDMTVWVIKETTRGNCGRTDRRGAYKDDVTREYVLMPLQIAGSVLLTNDC